MRTVIAVAIGVFFFTTVSAGEIVQPDLDEKQFRQARKVKVMVKEMRERIRLELERLIALDPHSKDRPDLLFRLAGNYYQEALSCINQAPREARKWREKEIAIYRQIVEEYPGYLHLDRVLYFLGYSLEEAGRIKESLSAFRRLIQAFPESRYVPEAYRSFGDYYFDQGKLEKALLAYQEVARHRESDLYSYSLFKQGWVYYNLQEYARAKQMFRRVLVLADRRLRAESLKAFVRTYCREGQVAEAPAVFERLAPGESMGMFSNLAGLYFSNGMYAKAATAYRILIREEKCSAEIPFYQAKIVECADRQGDPRAVVRQVRGLVDAYAFARQCLSAPTSAERLRLEEAGRSVEETLRRYAVEWHKQALRTRQRQIFAYASEFFGDYLQLFADSKYAYDLRFTHAELLFYHLRHYRQAADEYGRVAAAEGPRRCDAAYKAVAATRKIRKRPGLFLGAADRYLKHCAREEDACDVRFEAAGIHLQHDRYDKAVSLFDRVVRECPAKRLAVDAFRAIVTSLEQDNDLEKLERLSREYAKSRRLMENAKLKKAVVTMLPRIVFKRTERQAGLKAAKAFVGFAREFTGHRLADEALYNAASLYEQATKLDLSARVRNRLLEKYPRSELAPQVLFELAQNLERITRFKKATIFYERYVERFRNRRSGYKSAEAEKALMNAGIYREALREFGKAIDDRLLYVKLFPRSADAPRVLNSVGLLYERTGQIGAAARLYRRLYKSYRNQNPDLAIAAHMRRAEMLLKLKKPRPAAREMIVTLRLYNQAKRRGLRLPQAARAAAQADFMLAEPAFQRYAAFCITSQKVRRVKKQLAEKMRRLERVVKNYTRVVKRKQPEWAIASLYQLGRAYENLAETLEKGGVPPDFLGNIHKKAVTHYEAALEKSSQLGCYGEYTLLSRKRLEQLEPEKYPHQLSSPVTLNGHK
jgi:tetratricopeptide (TPR) repeat protein